MNFHLENEQSIYKNSEIRPEDLRVLLWDIDGTLIRSTRIDSFKDYAIPVLEKLFGTAGRLREMRVSGMTDLQILGEALSDHGYTHEQIRSRIAEIKIHYMTAMEEMMNQNREPMFQILPGVREVLERTTANPRYRSALLTGNIEPAAHLKMKIVGLSDFFTLPGAFGDDSHDRRDLPEIAAARINNHLDLNLRASQFIVIGDTPNDIRCARHFGARAVGVGTGRIYNAGHLRPLAPDALLQDLSDVDSVIRTLDFL
jgi:phosphoglycolate phosphatase